MADGSGPEAIEAAVTVEAAAAAEAEAELAAAQAAAKGAAGADGMAVVRTGVGESGGADSMFVADAMGGGPAVWLRLRQLLRCIEPYCHPSNSGMWSSYIGYLLQAIAQFTSWRVLHERSGLAASKEHALRPADISVIVRLLAPLVTRALYSRTSLMMYAQMSSRYLADLAPEYILPALQLRLCDGLQAVTAIHQTPMALQTLGYFASDFIDLSTAPNHMLTPGQPRSLTPAARRAHAAGPRVMLEALQLALPGIDPNDLDKMANALRFFNAVLLFVPVASSRWGDESPSRKRAAGDDASLEELEALGLKSREHTLERLRAEGDDEGLEALEAQEDEARSLCGWMPEFSEQLIRKLVGALDYFDKSAEGGRDAYRQSLYLMQWRHASSMLFQQLSEELFAQSLPEIIALLHRPSLLDSVKYVGALLSAATWANPELMLARALPPCFSALLTKAKKGAGGAMDGGDGESMALHPLSESELRWWVTILSHLIRKAGAALLPYLPQLRAVLRLTCTHTELEVMEASAKLRRHLLQSLLATYLTESRSLPPRVWRSASVRAAPWQTWGWRPPLQPASARVAAVCPSWHEPSAEELAAAGDLIEESLKKAESLLEGVESGAGAATSDALRGCLVELKAIARGALPLLTDEPAEGQTLSLLFEHPSKNAAFEPAVAEEVGVAEGDPMDVSPEDDDGSKPSPLRSVIPHAGKVAVTSCNRPLSRLATVVASLGEALATREAVRNLTMLLQVATLCVSERSTGKLAQQLQAMLSLGQRHCSIRGGGRPKYQPRAHLLAKIEVRHNQRLAATTFGFAGRTPAFDPLIKMLLTLSNHQYSSVRAEAQAGFATALRVHPWLARQALFPQIRLLAAPTALPHETKGAIFLLSTRAAIKKASSDYALLTALIVALVDIRDHQKPRLQQRARNLFSALCDHVPAPLPNQHMMPLPLLPPEQAAIIEQMRGWMGGAGAGVQRTSAESSSAIVRHYERASLRDLSAIHRAAEILLARMPNPANTHAPLGTPTNNSGVLEEVPAAAPAADKPGGPDSHWSREVGALCGLIILPLTNDEQRAAFAARAARGLCSANVTVRKLSRAALSMLLTRKRPSGPPVARPVAAPAELFGALPDSDEVWEATPKVDKLLGGWASDLQYCFPEGVGNTSALRPLGPLADELLTDPNFLKLALQWLVADHKEADTNDSGHSSRQSSDVVLSLLSPSRRWPSQPGHGVEFKDFELRHAQLFKGLAAKYGAAHMTKALIPSLVTLMGETASRDAQAVAAETVAGLVRGAARWPLSQQRELWATIGPELRKALRACSVQSLGDWQACLRYIAFNRDPRRLTWLAELLIADFESSGTVVDAADGAAAGSSAGSGEMTDGAEVGGMPERSLIQANHLRFLAPLVVELGWKGLPLLRRLLQSDLLRSWVSHPYRQVRDEVGSLLAIAMDACAPLPARFTEIGEAIHAEIAGFVQHLIEACHVPEVLVTGAVANATVVATQALPAAAEGVGGDLLLEPQEDGARSKARAARETVMKCLTHNSMQGRAFCAVEYSTALLPAIFTTAASMQPPDLSNAAKTCAQMAAHFPMHAERYAATIEAVAALASGGSWRLRGGLLPFIGLLAYRGQFIEPLESNTTALRAVLHTLMCDPQHEVREASAVILGGFVRLHGPPERMKTLKWARQRAKKGKPLVERHAGVLAYVALMQLAPYDVPAWLPEVVELLAAFGNEPQPIKATVSQAFADFKRTHQDNWASDRNRFTPEQLELISDMLVAPSFYA